MLQRLALALSAAVPNAGVIAGVIGVVSAFIDNVPLVAATMGMYDLTRVPPDSQLWQMIALAAGRVACMQPCMRGCMCAYGSVSLACSVTGPKALVGHYTVSTTACNQG